uniref:apyrase n=1 Tax=Culicoides sonorensis TaxID=179676 RepID=A0A336LSS0_CULSO
MNQIKFFFLLCVIFKVKSSSIPSNTFKLTIIHINDFHAHFEEMSPNSAECKTNVKCIGGYARLVYMVKHLQETHENPLYLNAGDNFQGTPWYTMFKWNVTKHFLNLLPADVITLGNHEFDHGIDGLLPFIGSIKSKLLVGNVDDDSKHFLQAYSNDRVHGRTILTIDGRKIGVIGVVIKTVDQLSNTGNITFLDEIMMVKRHARLLSKEDVDIIVVLSHCGIEIDKEIALKGGPLIDVIVGGHSHTYLYNGKDPNNPPDEPADKYPIVIEQDEGHKVLVVQAGCYGKYVGLLKLTFDNNGKVISWDGNPIYLGNHVKKDPEIEEEMKPWKKAVDKTGNRIIGKSKVLIDHSKCKVMECNAGNFVTDVMVESFQNITGHKKVVLAIYNAGGVRASIEAGPIKYNYIISMLPFGNYLELVKIPGKTLREAFEHAVSLPNNGRDTVFRNLLQVSGINVVYDLKREIGQRVEEILVLANMKQNVYKALQDDELYYVVLPTFLYIGGDGYTMFKRDQQHHEVGPIDIDAVMAYIERKKVLEPSLEARIFLKY